MSKPDKFRFRRLDSIGAAAAEQDGNYLETCFVNTGDLDQIKDCSNPRRIIVGRTGAGKTALLLQLLKEGRAIEVRPESLALSYVSNSTVLRFFAELGVKLDIFFRLLWRHVFTVELLKHHFKIYDEDAKRNFLQKFLDRFQDQQHRKAIEYVERWGKEFWQETEYRIQEVTTKLENNLKAAVEGKFSGINFTAGGAESLSQEQKAELIQRAQHVVNEVQIRQLSDVIKMLDDVLDDRQKRYYLVIDRLDEDWIEEQLRNRLIRALIETVKDFAAVRNAKIVIAIRLDLLQRVFRFTRDGGFQEEKYESLYLPLDWGKSELIDVLEKRINHLIRTRFGDRKVCYTDVLPRRVDEGAAIDYMLDRTMMRPRDLIQFFNFSIAKAADKPVLTAQMIREAEGEYSRDRLRSLGDEWIADYPNLLCFTKLLEDAPRTFPLPHITDAACGDIALKFVTESLQPSADDLSRAAQLLIDLQIDCDEFRRTVFYVYYRVGLVGLRNEKSELPRWTTAGRPSLSRSEVPPDCGVAIHPMFWRVFHAKQAIGFKVHHEDP